MQILLSQMVPTFVYAISGFAVAALVTFAAGTVGDGLSAFLLRTWLD